MKCKEEQKKKKNERKKGNGRPKTEKWSPKLV